MAQDEKFLKPTVVEHFWEENTTLPLRILAKSNESCDRDSRASLTESSNTSQPSQPHTPLNANHADAAETDDNVTKSEANIEAHDEIHIFAPSPLRDTSEKHLTPTRSCMDAQKQLVPLRDAVLTDRINARKYRDLYCQQRKLYHAIQEQLFAILTTAAREDILGHLKEEIYRLFGRLEIAMRELRIREEKTTSTENSLSDVEYRMGKLEVAVYADLDEKTRHAKGDGDQVQPDAMIFAGRADSENDHPPILDELYGRMGDLKVLQDRLHDFDFDLRQELAEREHLRATRQRVQLTDEELMESRDGERIEMEEQFAQTRLDVQNLKKQCSVLGIAYDDSDDTTTIPDTDSTSQHLPRPTDPGRSTRNVPSPASSSESIIDSFRNTRNRTADWIGHSPPHQESLEGVSVIWPPIDSYDDDSDHEANAPFENTCATLTAEPTEGNTTPVALSESAYIRQNPTIGPSIRIIRRRWSSPPLPSQNTSQDNSFHFLNQASPMP